MMMVGMGNTTPVMNLSGVTAQVFNGDFDDSMGAESELGLSLWKAVDLAGAGPLVCSAEGAAREELAMAIRTAQHDFASDQQEELTAKLRTLKVAVLEGRAGVPIVRPSTPDFFVHHGFRAWTLARAGECGFLNRGVIDYFAEAMVGQIEHNIRTLEVLEETVPGRLAKKAFFASVASFFGGAVIGFMGHPWMSLIAAGLGIGFINEANRDSQRLDIFRAMFAREGSPDQVRDAIGRVRAGQQRLANEYRNPHDPEIKKPGPMPQSVLPAVSFAAGGGGDVSDF